MEKDEEARSYNNINVDDTNNNNNYICSDDDNNNEEDGNDENNTKKKSEAQAWGTWEELLLACAVKRHGFGDWDSVATEVRSRSSRSNLFASANNCRDKYEDLKRRFQDEDMTDAVTVTTAEEDNEEDTDGNSIPWLEQLRSLRVAELRREVERYDVSILSLQLKVKKLEEEREEKPDLEDERKIERSENNGSESEHREKAVSAAEESDRENRSMNESNSTATVGENERVGGNEPSQALDNDSGGNNNPDPDPIYKDTAVSEGSEASHSDELGESGTSERKWKRKRRKHGGAGEIRSAESKSQPLIGLLDLIRSHPRGSLFERRLKSQEAKDYKSMIKQHLDIETIQRKLKQGSYDSSSLPFYRDLQLVFTNAIVFFPLSSPESMAAHELRSVVSEEMRKETGKSGPRLIKREVSAINSGGKANAEKSDSSFSKQITPAPLVVCRRRGSVSTKASPSSSSFSQKEEIKEEALEKENIVTGVRSSRRASKAAAATAAANNTKKGKGKNKQKQTDSKTNSSNDNSSKQETAKTEKKTVSSDKKKSVADFLNRLKKNSPQKESKDQNKSGKSSGKKESETKPRERRSSTVGKKKANVETTPEKRAPGRPQKKTAEAGATASASGKRGRDTGSTGKDNKQPKKRIRR